MSIAQKIKIAKGNFERLGENGCKIVCVKATTVDCITIITEAMEAAKTPIPLVFIDWQGREDAFSTSGFSPVTGVLKA